MPPVIRLDRPARDLNESFLLGNGALGAAVRGRPGVEHVDLNRDTFWSGGPGTVSAAPADPAGTVARLRSAIDDARWAEAEEAGAEIQGDSWSQSYQPVGHLSWRWSDVDETSPDHRRTLDLGDAVATVRADASDRSPVLEAFASRPADVVVLEAHHAPVDAEPAFASPHPLTDLGTLTVRPDADAPPTVVSTWGGRAPAHVVPQYVDDHPDPVTYATDVPDADGLVDAGTGFVVAVARQQVDATTARLLVAVVDGFRGRHERPSADLAALRATAVATVLAAASRSTAELRDEHVADHRALVDRVTLELSEDDDAVADDRVDAATTTGPADRAGTATALPTTDEVAPVGSAARDALTFAVGRYLLVASSRAGTQPSNLQGIWNADVRPGWSANHTLNINTEMLYWPVHRTGLGELAGPLRELAGDLAVTGRRTARDFYDMDGWAAHHNTDLWGFSAPVAGGLEGQSAWANFPTAGTWVTAQVLEELDWDPSLRDDPERVAALWSLAEGAARFVLDLLVPDADGRLVVSPSTSPEHRFVTDDGASTFCAGAAVDQELVRDLLTRLPSVAPAEPDGAARRLLDDAAGALARLRPVVVGRDGALLEWDVEREPTEPGHRHLSHLYGLFPGTARRAEADPDGYAASVVALEQRVAAGSGHTGWSQSWILCLAARARRPELVARSLDVLQGDLASTSLLDLHPVDGFDDGRTHLFQMEGNAGATTGIAEALLDGAGREVAVLPAAPVRWARGSFTGLRTHGGHAVDAAWDRDGLVSLAVTLGSDDDVVLVLPDGDRGLVRVGSGTAGRRGTAGSADAPAHGATRRLPVAGRAGDRVEFVRPVAAS